jgi:hypothetical protein
MEQVKVEAFLSEKSWLKIQKYDRYTMIQEERDEKTPFLSRTARQGRFA